MPELEVFHDGDCLVCRMEVEFYRRLDSAGRIRWTDIVALEDGALPPGKSRAELLGRFHARELRHADDPAGNPGGNPGGNPAPDLRWHVGVDAFARIWRSLPFFRRFAWLFSMPGIRTIAEFGYRAFLRWQAADRRRRNARRPLA